MEDGSETYNGGVNKINSCGLHTAQILISPGGCQGRSESLLNAKPKLLVWSRRAQMQSELLMTICQSIGSDRYYPSHRKAVYGVYLLVEYLSMVLKFTNFSIINVSLSKMCC